MNSSKISRGILRLEILVLLVPLLVASTQIYLSQTNNLTSWKGGGFGMYVAPHPNTGRFVVLVDSLRLTSLLLYPSDARIDRGTGGSEIFYASYSSLSSKSASWLVFPGNVNPRDWFIQYESMLSKAPPELATILPREELWIHFFEIRLTDDFRQLSASPIHSISQ